MGLRLDALHVIARGAFLHDIGKIATPDSILLKPGKLNREEVRVMREHCTQGYQIVRKIPFLREASEIVYAHQERFDGTGYPRGLKGDQIPLGARIFAVADTLDAITSDRPYRKGANVAAAHQEIARCSGLQFDPTVVRVFLGLPSKLWGDLRTEVSLLAATLPAASAVSHSSIA
jgi:putative nucleotidyltransferase with HDIG domain